MKNEIWFLKSVVSFIQHACVVPRWAFTCSEHLLGIGWCSKLDSDQVLSLPEFYHTFQTNFHYVMHKPIRRRLHQHTPLTKALDKAK